jgi:protein gp37
VNSMSDLFHEGVPEDYIVTVARVMEMANWHTYQVLTKRSKRMQVLLAGGLSFAARLPHIWWGVSVEDRRYGLPRIDDLRRSPAVVRFLSIEPLLEDLGRLDLSGIHWVIVGGESGPGARPMNSTWVQSILRQCRKARIPFFFKQWGGIKKGEFGRLLNGRTYDEFPTRMEIIMPSREHRRSLAGLLDPHASLVQLQPEQA